MEPKICPILGAGPLEINSNCKGEHCAWYIANRKCCALKHLAENSEVIAYRLDDIAAGDIFGQQ